MLTHRDELEPKEGPRFGAAFAVIAAAELTFAAGIDWAAVLLHCASLVGAACLLKMSATMTDFATQLLLAGGPREHEVQRVTENLRKPLSSWHAPDPNMCMQAVLVGRNSLGLRVALLSGRLRLNRVLELGVACAALLGLQYALLGPQVGSSSVCVCVCLSLPLWLAVQACWGLSFPCMVRVAPGLACTGGYTCGYASCGLV